MKLSDSHTFADAVTIFRAKNLAGEIVDGRDGEPVMLSKGRVNVILSHVRAALKRATGIKDRKALYGVTLRPYVAALPEWAYRYAKEAQERKRAARGGKPKSQASSYRSDVVTFLRVVEGVRPDTRRHKRRVSEEAFLTAWHPLGAALLENPHTGERFRRYAGWLEKLQCVALQHDVDDPARLPDYTTLREWCVDAKIPEKQVADLFTAFRKARELSGRLDLTPLEAPAPAWHRGVQTLPDLEALVKRACERRTAKLAAKAALRGLAVPAPVTCDRPVATLSPTELLRQLAPEFAKAVEHYQAFGAAEDRKSADWLESVASAASVIVAELYRLPPTRRLDGTFQPEDPWALDPRHLFTERRLIPARHGAAPATEHADGIEDLDGLDAADEVRDVAFEDVPLLRVVVDAAARRSFVASSITLPPLQAEADVPFYTEAVFNNLTALWAVVRQVFGTQLGFVTKKRDEWERIKSAHKSVSEHMKSHNATRETEGHLDKGLLTVLWGQAVCVGIPALWKEAHRLRAAWIRKENLHARLHQTTENGGDSSMPIGVEARRAVRHQGPVRRARAAYFEALRRWATFAVPTDDMMRMKNYARGTINRNFLLDLMRHAEGTVVTNDLGTPQLAGVVAKFRGYDRDAGTKKRRTRRGAERVRSRRLSPGVVDMTLLADFVFELRVDDLVGQGKLAEPSEYRVEEDAWALFTQPGSKRTHGGYSRARLSARWGRTLHWIHRDLLELRDAELQPLPAWEEMQGKAPAARALRARYRGLFSGHYGRSLGALYLVGVHKDVREAVHRTNDTREVLEDFYTEHEATLNEARKLPGLRNPDWFKAVTEELVRGRVIDWACFDPKRPDETMRVLANGVVTGPRPRRKPARR